MKKKSLAAKNTKKALPKKATAVNKSKASSKKTLNKVKKTLNKKPKTTIRRLGKGLRDISHLFLSGVDKSSAKLSLKTKKTAAKKIKKAPVPKAKKALTPAGKKTSRTKAKKTLSTLRKKAVKTVVSSLTKKALFKKKENSAKTKKIIKKPSKKKTEVIRMPIAKRSGKKAESTAKISKEVVGIKLTKKTKTGVKKKAQLRPISELSSLYKKKKKSETVLPGVGTQPEQVVEESKFFTGLSPVKERQLYELPDGYGDTRIIIQVRDPYWMHAYWEISEDKTNSVSRDLGRRLHDARHILRVYDITNVIFDGSNANKYFDININDYASSWYINGGEAGRSFCVEIGYLLADGRFIMIARSNYINMPIDGPSTITDEEWMMVEDDFNRLYGMSVGLGIGLSSMELRKQISQRLTNLSSGVLSSPGGQRKQSAKKFWLKVHTELIVYGATVPGAKVSVQGKPINLSKDGTFNLRFALPDGQQVIPVKAVSVDGLEERLITPVVNKKTE